MRETDLLDLLHQDPIIPGIKNEGGLQEVLTTNSKVVFVLFGDILNISAITKMLKENGKAVFVNVDLIEGFSSKDIVIKYLKEHTLIDGILSSKAPMIKAARKLGLLTIYRFFMLDSFSFYNLPKQLDTINPDLVEMIPGCMPRVIQWTMEEIRIPLIAGGLVCDKTDAMAALSAGALAITSTNQRLWRM